MSALRGQIAALLASDPADVALAQSIFGTADVEAIASRVEGYCREQLGSPVEGCDLFTQSVGAVLVLRLASGERVVLKVHGEDTSRLGAPASFPALTAVYAIQGALARDGFPCAAVVRLPRPWPGGWVAAMSHVDGDRAEDPHQPAVRRAMAETWTDLLRLLRPFRETPDLPVSARPSDRVLPKPHNVLFDIDAPGGAWIDERARIARATLDRDIPPPMLVHTDISAANVRVREGRVRAVYDMDSLALGDELAQLAHIAVHYSYTGEPGGSWPSREEAAAFVEDYERVRPQPFTPTERARLDAAAIYGMAYTARCEHSIRPDEGPDSMRERLRRAPPLGFFSP
jgi:aminoglycoside phosphotransferase (APT) family kinase protein